MKNNSYKIENAKVKSLEYVRDNFAFRIVTENGDDFWAKDYEDEDDDTVELLYRDETISQYPNRDFDVFVSYAVIEFVDIISFEERTPIVNDKGWACYKNIEYSVQGPGRVIYDVKLKAVPK